MKNINFRAPAIGIPPEREPRTVNQEIEWLKENFRMEKPLIVETILIALKQRLKRVPDTEKEHWNQVITELKKM